MGSGMYLRHCAPRPPQQSPLTLSLCTRPAAQLSSYSQVRASSSVFLSRRTPSLVCLLKLYNVLFRVLQDEPSMTSCSFFFFFSIFLPLNNFESLYLWRKALIGRGAHSSEVICRITKRKKTKTWTYTCLCCFLPLSRP